MIEGIEWPIHGGVVALTSFLSKYFLPLAVWTTLLSAQVTQTQIRSELKALGIEFSEKADGPAAVFSFQLNGHEALLRNNGKDAMLRCVFSGDVPLARINEWNRTHRFSRAFLQDRNEIQIEEDLSFAGGVNQEGLGSFLTRFRTSVAAFSQLAGLPPTPANTDQSPILSVTKSPKARKRIAAPFGNFAIWVDDTQWKQVPSDETGVLEFQSTDDIGYAKLISERMAVPVDNLKQLALINMRKKDPNATVISEEHRRVNGAEVLAMNFDVVTQGITFKFMGYYFGGKSGSLQLVTYTASSLYAENQHKLAEFLNGLEISDEALPPQPEQSATGGHLQINPTMALDYDPAKWKSNGTLQDGKYHFAYSAGDAYALVIPERLTVPADSWTTIVLANAHNADPNAKIVSQEKRMVNGVEVLVLRTYAEVAKIPFEYYGYYYSANGNAVQVLTYGGRDLMKDLEPELTKFLNGLKIAQ
jgi:hypothetical protein